MIRGMRVRLRSLLLIWIAIAMAPAWAATHTIGPGQDLASLSKVILKAGDVVRVHPGARLSTTWTVEAHGTASAPVTIEGLPAAGQRHVEIDLTACKPDDEGDKIVHFKSCSHVVFRNFRLFGARAGNFIKPGANGERVLYITGPSTEVAVVNCKVDHNHAQGFAGGDATVTGLRISRSEFGFNGVLGARSAYYHNIYLSTAEVAFDGCYIHDSFYAPPGIDLPSETDGGQNLKVRAGSISIRASLIVSGFNAALHLVDGKFPAPKFDIAGSIIVKPPRKASKTCNVIGGDSGAEAWTGRFVNCTFITRHGGPVIDSGNKASRASIEFYNNAFVSVDGLPGSWGTQVAASGSHNFFGGGVAEPSGLVDSVSGKEAGFAGIEGLDFRLTAVSILRGKGRTALPAGCIEPTSQYLGIAESEPRPDGKSTDIGAYAFGVVAKKSSKRSLPGQPRARQTDP
jgi:hypothetical protein